MERIKYIIYASLWIIYMISAFTLHTYYNSNVAFVSIVLVALGAWLFGTQVGLIISMFSIPYHYFLFDHLADQLHFYQGNLIGVLAYIFICYYTGILKSYHLQAVDLKTDLEQAVAARTNQLNQLIHKLISDDEKTRQSLAQEIHDGLGQNMTGLVLYSGSLHETLKRTDLDSLRVAADVAEDISRTHQVTRKLPRTLLPFWSTESGFEAAVDELISFFSETTSVEFSVHLDGCDGYLNQAMAVQFYRITHEVILNTTHYETPSHIDIKLSKDNDECVLCIVIEGCRKAAQIADHTFMQLIRYRAKLVSGELRIAIPLKEKLSIECRASHTLPMK